MSELKAFDIVVAEEGYCEGYVKYRRAVYDKAEVDKVISELKADYKEACGRLQNANLIKDEQLAATRHQKYKRCLAMSERCKDKIENAEQYNEHDDWLIINEYWERWHKRWQELAMKFKEAK